MSLQAIQIENTPGKLEPISATEFRKNIVPSIPRMTRGLMNPVQKTFKSVLNHPPVIVTKNAIRYDQIMDTLLDAGYLIDYRLYSDQTVTHLLAKTLLGDRFLIKVDSPQYQATFPKLHTNKTQKDIQLEHFPDMTLVPQETKMGTLKCLNYDICGAAFICEGNICTSERPLGSKQIQEDQYTMQTPQRLNSQNDFEPSSIALPIVSLKSLLNDPQDYIQRIAKINSEIVEVNAELLQSRNKTMIQELELIQTDLKALQQVLLDIKGALDEEIATLTQSYLRFAGQEMLPEPIQSEYYLLLKTISQKKELRRRILTSIENAYNSTIPLKDIPKIIRAEVDPLLQEYARS